MDEKKALDCFLTGSDVGHLESQLSELIHAEAMSYGLNLIEEPEGSGTQKNIGNEIVHSLDVQFEAAKRRFLTFAADERNSGCKDIIESASDSVGAAEELLKDGKIFQAMLYLNGVHRSETD